MSNIQVLDWNNGQEGFQSLSKEEQEFYYWVNYSRLNPSGFFETVVMPLVNVYPQLKGKNLESLELDLKNTSSLPLLSLDGRLLKMAVYQSKSITVNDANPSHTSVDGESFVDRFKKFGLKNCGGENISWGGGEASPLFMLVMLYLDINVADLGHRKALLNPSFINTGISISKYKNGNTFLVEDFACSQK